MGKPVFKGTRLTVKFVLERISEVASIDDLVQYHFGLTPKHVRAATAYAASVLRRDERVSSA